MTKDRNGSPTEQKRQFRIFCNEQSIFITNSTNKPGNIFIPPGKGVLNLFWGSLDSFENVMKIKISSLKEAHINKILHAFQGGFQILPKST